MKSIVLLSLSFLPSSLALALHVRESNSTIPTSTIKPSISPIIPAPTSHYTQADVIPNCARWDLVLQANPPGPPGPPGPSQCSDFLALYPDVSFADLTLWNPSVGPACDNIWSGYWFCTAISGAYIPPIRDTPAGVPIKSPIKQQPSNTHPANCDRLDVIPFGASCQTILSRYPGISIANLQEWNPFIVRPLYPCWLDPMNDLCTSVVGYVFTAPPTQPGVPPPAPTQNGVDDSCMEWDTVQAGDSCSTFMDRYGITLEQMVEWNPAVGVECAGLWGGYAVCVGV